MWSRVEGNSRRPKVGRGVLGLSGVRLLTVPTLERPVNRLFSPIRTLSSLDGGGREARADGRPE
jgi:hypothetical protein